MVEELVKITLQNEMDLVLAHKSAMKLAELAGLSLPAQTTFATAVSEVSRYTIENGKDGYLLLCATETKKDKFIVARILDRSDYQRNNQGLEYAKRLVSTYSINTAGNHTAIELNYLIPAGHKLDLQQMVPLWQHTFSSEQPFSPYAEIKRKNEQLQELAEKLQERENQYVTLTNSLPIIIFSLDAKGQLIYANEWLLLFTGQTAEQLNSSRWKDIIHPADYDTFCLLMTPEMPSGATAVKTQFRLKHIDGSDYYWHLASVSPMKGKTGELQYWTGFIVDINAQKLVEEALQDNQELKRTQQQLEDNQTILESNIHKLNQSNLELQQFAFIASHDLQEPIRKISFYSDVLLSKYSGHIDEKGNQYLRGILNASSRMRRLIHDLLAFSQVEKRMVEFSRIDLNEVVQDALQDLEMIITERTPIIEITSLPSIEADNGLVRQLFANILSNSLKYVKDNQQPVIRISHHMDNGNLEVSISDNGIGFDEKYLPKIFTLFQRLHTNDKYKGTGLGLAICRKIVELHNGSIAASSRENEGATFKITLPVKQPVI